MNKTKLLTTLLLLLSLTIGFNACKTDDEENNSAPAGSAIKKIKTKLVGDGIGLDADLTYVANKIFSCRITSPYIPLFHANVYVKDQGNTITISTKAEGEKKTDIIDEWFGYDDDWKFTYKLQNGRAVSCLYEVEWDNGKDVTNITFDYDAAGYLSKIVEVRENYTSEILFIYKDGNMAKLEYIDYANNEPSQRETMEVYYIASSEFENKNNVAVDQYLIAAAIARDTETSYMYAAHLGIFGKTSKMLPNRVFREEPTESKNIELFNMAYRFDKNDNIIYSLWTDVYHEEKQRLELIVSY